MFRTHDMCHNQCNFGWAVTQNIFITLAFLFSPLVADTTRLGPIVNIMICQICKAKSQVNWLFSPGNIFVVYLTWRDFDFSSSKYQCRIKNNSKYTSKYTVTFGCQLDEPYGFPDDHQQNAAMFQCHVNIGIHNFFSITASLLYSVGNFFLLMLLLLILILLILLLLLLLLLLSYQTRRLGYTYEWKSDLQAFINRNKNNKREFSTLFYNHSWDERMAV